MRTLPLLAVLLLPSVAPEDVVRAARDAGSLAEWRASGMTPEAALASSRNAASTCDALARLSGGDLSYFEETLEEDGSFLPCREPLLARIQERWDAWRELYAKREKEAPAPVRPLDTLSWELDASTGPVLSSGGLPDGHFSFTFDDGPHRTRTDAILRSLGEAGVRANFFLLGKQARRLPDVALRAARDGHVLGSHSMTHESLPSLPLEAARREIAEGHTAVFDASAGRTAPFFRFPYGNKTTALQAYVKGKGLATFGWNVDTLDWKLKDPDALYAFVVSELRKAPSGIVLFHDIQEQTKLVLPRVFTHFSGRSLRPVVFTPR